MEMKGGNIEDLPQLRDNKDDDQQREGHNRCQVHTAVGEKADLENRVLFGTGCVRPQQLAYDQGCEGVSPGYFNSVIGQRVIEGTQDR